MVRFEEDTSNPLNQKHTIHVNGLWQCELHTIPFLYFFIIIDEI